MAVNYAAAAMKPVPQTQPIRGREHEMEKNAAGGFGFTVDAMTRLRRFLILGASGGTYYVNESEHIKENFSNVLEALKVHGIDAVKEIIDISASGRAPNNKPALFAMACAAASENLQTKTLALSNLSKVARTASDLLYFSSQVNEMRGWGKALRRAVANWFTERNPDNLAYQAMKYRQRDGWALSDLLRLSHPKTDEAERNAIFKWLVDSEITEATPERLVAAHNVITGKVPEDELAAAVTKFKLPREVLPTEALNRMDVWQALMEEMPGHAMLRNLGKMTNLGLLKPLNAQTSNVTSTFGDGDYLRKARLHPLQILLARYVYGLGKGIKGSLTWEPVTQILEALDSAFYSAFDESLMTKKSALIAIDTSASMGSSRCAGNEHMAAREGGAMLALALKRVIPNCHTLTFDTQLHNFQLTGQPSFEAVKTTLEQWRGGGTNCDLPFQYILDNNIDPDAIIVITDNETWAGQQHAIETLAKIRKRNATKCILVAMTATRTSIADSHPDNLETVGFDASLARVVTDFMDGRI